MFDRATVKVIIPALNESASIAKVLADIPSWVDEVIVVDNGSTDDTSAVASAAGARVVCEPRRGYGQACLAGIAAIGWCDVVVFLDGDYSDFPEQMDRLLAPIAQDRAEMVLGRRVAVHGDKEAFTLPQRFGTGLACHLMRMFWRGRYRDMGPFRAIRWSSLRSLEMRDTTYGWTVEMQIKALLAGLRVKEVPVDYRRRIGASKISGTVRGVWGAGSKILGTIGKFLLHPPALPRSQPERLIVLGRRPKPGTTKTRLIPSLGALGAAELQRRMTVRTMNAARIFAAGDQREVEFRHEGGSWRQMRRWLGPGIIYRRQSPGDLGHRMSSAMEDAFDKGCRRAALIGTDAPGVTSQYLDDAFGELDDHDLVLGPTLDGGYCLIAMKRPLPVFEGIAWSTEHVLAQTLDAANRLGLKVHLLEPLADVDLADDLPLTSEFFNPAEPMLSVIIPARNEAENIEAAIRSARKKGVEIIVVDGDSADETADLAASLDVLILHSPPGRARQQNAGAEVAQADVLLFLHADTILPPDFESYVFEALMDTRVAGGGFGWRTTQDGTTMRIASFSVRLRTVYGQDPWGDQAIFVRKADFQAVGGFPDVPIAEDWSFVRNLRRRGRIVAVPGFVITSARRWRKSGVLKTFLINRLIVLGCQLGVPRNLLAQLY